MAVHSLIRVESLNSACVNSLEFAEMILILFVPFWDCNNAAPIPVRRILISSSRVWCSVVHSKLFCSVV